MAVRVSHQEVVKRFLDTKAVDFTAIGKAVSELGPTAALSDDPWDLFCGTMRRFVRVYILDTPQVPVLEDLQGLRNVGTGIK
jgi:hypothetical protein